MSKFYTGVGSRSTPRDIMIVMKRLATHLAGLGYVLRSGGADGADTAFASGAKHKNIYLPSYVTDQAMGIARRFHPAWNRCSSFARRLHARNAFQVLGLDLDSPSKFLICWTPDGCYNHNMRSIKTGGTGTAISIADHYGVQVFNLNHAHHYARLTIILK
jgi:hypothetical protein